MLYGSECTPCTGGDTLQLELSCDTNCVMLANPSFVRPTWSIPHAEPSREADRERSRTTLCTFRTSPSLCQDCRAARICSTCCDTPCVAQRQTATRTKDKSAASRAGSRTSLITAASTLPNAFSRVPKRVRLTQCQLLAQPRRSLGSDQGSYRALPVEARRLQLRHAILMHPVELHLPRANNEKA